MTADSSDYKDIYGKFYQNLQDNVISGHLVAEHGVIANDSDTSIGDDGYIDDDDNFHYTGSSSIQENPQQMINFMIYHRNNLAPIYRIKKDYYKGRHLNILNQRPKSAGDPDNRLIVDLPRKLVDTFGGYFIGTPIKMAYNDKDGTDDSPAAKKINDFVNDFMTTSKFDAVLKKASKSADIYGRGYIYEYNDDDGTPGLAALTPIDTFIIYDDTVANKQIAGIRYWQSRHAGNGALCGELITEDKVLPFVQGKPGEDVNTTSLEFDEKINKDGISSRAHPVGVLPIVEVVDNDERLGVFDSVLSLIDNVDKTVSEKGNDVDYFADSLLVIKGVRLTEQQTRDAKTQRVFNLYPKEDADIDNSAAMDVKFVAKDVQDTLQENALNRNIDLIYQIAQIANLDDVQFNTAAATALDFKLHSMKTMALTKEGFFSAAILQIMQAVFASSGQPDDAWKGLEIDYNLTIPHNVADEANTAKTLQGITSRETALKELSIVTDPKTEVKKLDDENKDQAKQFAQNSPDSFYTQSGPQPSTDDVKATKAGEDDADS